MTQRVNRGGFVGHTFGGQGLQSQPGQVLLAVPVIDQYADFAPVPNCRQRFAAQVVGQCGADGRVGSGDAIGFGCAGLAQHRIIQQFDQSQ